MEPAIASCEDSVDLLLVVERLSTRDQRRIVRLIDLLCLAPDDLRRETQSRLKDLIARQAQTHSECLAIIDEIIETTVRELESTKSAEPRDPRSAPACEAAQSG